MMNGPERADDIASDELLELIDAIEPQQDDEARDSTSAYLAEIGLIPDRKSTRLNSSHRP